MNRAHWKSMAAAVLGILTLASTFGPGAVASADAESRSPLAAYAGFRDPEVDEAQFLREERQREQRVAGCMREAGFRYTPAPSVVVDGPQEEPPPDVDPNEAYAASLDPAARSAYYLALVGVSDPNAQEASELPDPDGETGGGCVGEALREIPGVYEVRGRLADELDAMEEAIAADPRLGDAETRWSTCMRDAGHAFRSPAHLHASLDDAVASVLGVGSLGRTGLAVELELGAVERRYHRALEASEACLEPLEEVLREVRYDHETAFVSEHRTILEGDA